MTITELKQKREDLRTQMQSLVSNGESEKRELTEDEALKFEELKQQIEDIASEIEDLVDELTERSKQIKPITQIRKMETKSLFKRILDGEREINMPLFEQREVQVL
jgi:TolA-binding protein